MGRDSASDIVEIGIVLSLLATILLTIMITLNTGSRLNFEVAETGRKTELAREARRTSYFDNTEVYGNDIASLINKDEGKFIIEVELLDGSRYKWDSNSNFEDFRYDEISKHMNTNSVYTSNVVRADNQIDILGYRFKEKVK